MLLSKRIIIPIVIGLILVIAVLAVIFRVSATNDVEVMVAPNDAKISLESGEVLINGQTNSVPIGNYKVTISRDGFSDESVNLYVAKDTVSPLAVILKPSTSGGAKQLLNESNQQLITAIEKLDDGILSGQYDQINDFELSSCPSVRYPDNDNVRAVCLAGRGDQDYTAALLKMPQSKYMEVLYGSPSQYNVYSDNIIQVQHVSSLETDKPTLFIKVLNGDLLNQSTAEILDKVRQSLDEHLYNPDNYYFIYGDQKLDDNSNVPERFDDDEDHLHGPYEVPGVSRE